MEAFLKRGKQKKAAAESDSPMSIDDEDELIENSTPVVAKSNRKKYPVPWVEKYRPRHITDVVQQEEVVALLGKTIKGADLPNLLFYGPPGTGKTSTILAAARQLFGDNYKERILELNASDERGISVIREKVKKFSQFTASGNLPDGRPCPPFKLVILDEADAMTGAAQAALRRTMEKETKSTRFCLLCNYLSRIIPPLTSRCSKFRFQPLKDSNIRERLEFICGEEGVSFESGVLGAIIKTSDGDMRRAITNLQSCYRLKGKNHKLNIGDVHEVTGVLDIENIQNLFRACETNNYDKVDEYVEEMIRLGYPASKILEQCFVYTLEKGDLSDDIKAKIFEKISECNYRLIDGASEYLQLMDLGSTIMKLIS